MKTAMQIMLDDLLAKREVYENAKMYECVATLETSIEIAEYLIEKEKEQIINAFNGGRQSENDNKAIDHYNFNYNQNK